MIKQFSESVSTVTHEDMLKLIAPGETLTYKKNLLTVNKKLASRPGATRRKDDTEAFLYYLNLQTNNESPITSKEGYFLDAIAHFIYVNDEVEGDIGSGKFNKITKKSYQKDPPIIFLFMEFDHAEMRVFEEETLPAQNRIFRNELFGYEPNYYRVVDRLFEKVPNTEKYQIKLVDENGKITLFPEHLSTEESLKHIRISDKLVDGSESHIVTEKHFEGINSDENFQIRITTKPA